MLGQRERPVVRVLRRHALLVRIAEMRVREQRAALAGRQVAAPLVVRDRLALVPADIRKLILFAPLGAAAWLIGAPISIALSAYALAVITDTLAS